MAKTIKILEMTDIAVDPKDSGKFKTYMLALGEAIGRWVLDGKNVLVACKKGQNRSAAVCVLAHQHMARELDEYAGFEGCVFADFEGCVFALHEAAAEAKVEGHTVPTKFLSSSGGSYYQTLFMMNRNRNRDRKTLLNHGGVSIPHDCPYVLEYSPRFADHGSLWIGNLEGLERARIGNLEGLERWARKLNSQPFDIFVDVSGNVKDNVDRVAKWKDIALYTDLYGSQPGL